MFDKWNRRAAATDQDFAFAVHNGQTWVRRIDCHDEGRNGVFVCSNCKVSVDMEAVRGASGPVPIFFCPSCGCRIEVEQ